MDISEIIGRRGKVEICIKVEVSGKEVINLSVRGKQPITVLHQVLDKVMLEIEKLPNYPTT